MPNDDTIVEVALNKLDLLLDINDAVTYYQEIIDSELPNNIDLENAINYLVDTCIKYKEHNDI